MVAYNFQGQFADDVAALIKRNTIRPRRKRHARVGEPVQLYTGQRSKACRKLVMADPVCTSVKSISIWAHGLTIGGVKLATPERLNAFARADGFADWPSMRDWFDARYGLPFDGVFVGWEPDGATPGAGAT